MVTQAGATAAQVEKNTASIQQQGKDITANAEQIRSVKATVNDPNTGVNATAQGLSQVKGTVEVLGNQVKANAQKLDGVFVQVNPALAGSEEGFAGSEQTYVGAWSEQSARIEGDIAQAQRTDQVEVRQGETNALVQQVSKSVVDLQGSTAQQFSQVQAQQAQTSAAVQRNDKAIVDANGRVSAISSWKTETNVNGKKVQTGIVQGSDGSVSEILLAADRVAIINGLNGDSLNSMFIFQDGKAYFNTALINQAYIREIILGMTLRSQATDSQGRPLLEINVAAGTFTLRGQDANGSTLINNGGLFVYDNKDIERAGVGRLTSG
ncbi:DUF1983 domain-containing protein [Pseudomonas sp. REB1044]|uniref:phage tail tip fiber protein n=1 Tax=Pseudomonas sp. REB1044 TaxID=2675224 RepID=UPI00315CB715